MRLRANRMAMISLFLFLIILLFSLLGPLFSKYRYDEQDLEKVFLAPGAEHWFGTDNLGRDLFARTSHGGRLSLIHI